MRFTLRRELPTDEVAEEQEGVAGTFDATAEDGLSGRRVSPSISHGVFGHFADMHRSLLSTRTFVRC
jgi:hypothetical protein